MCTRLCITIFYWGKHRFSRKYFSLSFLQGVLAIAIVQLCGVAEMRAQSPAYYCYTTQQGLTCEEIYDVHQDKSGFIWVASDRGVFRFDGYTFRPFTTAQGLTDNTVFRIHEDYKGRIWLMPFSGDLCYIENEKVTNYPFNDTIEKYLPGVRVIRSISVHESGTIEIGVLIHGYVNISAEGKLTREKATSGASRTFWVREGESSELLMGSSETFNLNSNAEVQFVGKTVSVLGRMEKIPLKHHLSVVKRFNGSIVFCVGPNIYEMDNSGACIETSLPFHILTIMEDQQHCLWAGTDGGLLKYQPAASVAGGKYELFYPNEIITSVIEDREGAFWVATHHNGLFYLPNVNIRAWSIFENDEARCLLPDSTGTMYVLWRDHGLTSISSDTAIVYNANLGKKYYNTIAWTEKHEAMLIGTADGAYHYNIQTNEHKEIFPSSVNSIACDSGKTYLGSSWNLCRINPIGERIIVGDPLIRHRPDVLLKGYDGTMWVGTLDGLYRVADTVLESVSEKHDLFTRRIAGMCQLPDATLVVATQSNGIAFLHNGIIQTLTQNDQFPCDHVYGVVAGLNNSLWCSTQEGLYEIHVSRGGISFEEQRIMKTIVGHGGKPGFVPSTNQLWVCDGNRVISFSPSATSVSTTSPPIYITGVFVGDSVLQMENRAELAYNENTLRISFCGIAYRLQGNVNYRYRLKGGDEWQFTKQNTLEFASLGAGDYVFEVQAQNENGLWSSQAATFSFNILSPFWATWWFIGVCIIAGGLLLYVATVLRFRMIRRRDLLREQALIFRQQALASQMNPHFVFNTLNTIQAFVLKEEKTKALDMFSSFASLLRASLEHSTERYIPLEEELRILKLYFELEEMRFEGDLSYEIILGKNIETEKLSVPAMLIQPLVENALVHGLRRQEGGGEVVIRFDIRSEKLICEVEDNGIGRNAAGQFRKSHSSAGMRITRDRLRVIGQMNNENYSFDIIDKVNPGTGEALGTLVRFALPYTINKTTVDEKAESINS